MVGIMATSPRDKAINLHNSIKLAMDIPSKLHNLRQLKDILMNRDPSLVPEFVPLLVELQFDCTSPTRRFLAELIGEIGLKHVRFLPEIVPVLISFLNDDTPAVARQAITCGMELFRDILEKVTVQGLYTGQLDSSVQSAWAWILKFKEAVYEIAFQPGSDGVRLLAVKFFEALVLLFTPDPNGSSRPPPQQDSDGKIVEFNISWLNGGHPVLNARDLAIEASRNLGLLLDQLRSPLVKMLSNSVITVLINSLSAIARKRPTFYGRILPVLLGLDRSNLMTKGVQGSTVHLALKNGFLSCLRSTHPGAAPWRDRLVDALKTMNAGEMAEQALLQVDELPKTMGSDFGEAQPMKEMKTSTEEFDRVHIDTGRKRFVAQEISDRAQDDGTSGKRVKPTLGSDGSNLDFVSDHFSLIGTSLSGDGDSGPVQQLVAMFGALVAQGEKAVDSLEILISSTSSDLLAEVVMANMRHLPASRPNSEDDEEVTLNTTSLSSLVSNNNSLQAFSSVSDIQSLSSAFPQIASFLGAQPLASNDISNLDSMEELPKEVVTDKALVPCDRNVPTIVLDPSALVIPSVRERDSSALVIPSVRERDSLTISPDINGIWNSQSGIPGLDNAEYVDGMQDTVDVSQSSSADPVGTYHEQVTSSGGTLSLDRSEALSPKATGTEASCTSSTVSTSVVLSTEYLSQKMPLPILSLTDQQKDHLQKLVFVRIIEAYKQLAAAGGSDIRFYLLAYFGVEYPLELDSIGVLRYHILSDYINHEGHELTLRILYRLFREAEQENDFLLSTSATSIYETFLLTVAETLRDSLPASDKSLSRLFSEVPYLPAPAFKLLEGLCSPGKNEKYDKESHNGDRVTQGLSAVWNLIILRPPIRDACLKIALQSAVHHLEEVRMKAIRLVANKLYPLPIIAQRIEDFANEMLLSVANASHSREGMDAEVSTNVTEKDLNLERLPNGGNPLREANVTGGEVPTVNNQLVSAENASSSSVSEAQRCMSLYFALCTKKHSLLRQVFVVYKSTMPAVKQAVHRHIPILVRTIGSSPELLAIISDPPVGSEMLLMQVLHTLTDGTTPSPDLISTVRRLYDSKLKDAQILIPILPSLSKDEVLPIFPQLVDLPLDKFQAALARILQGSSHKGPSLSPAEVLIAIHGIDLERDGIPLKKVTDACSACFEQRGVFTQQVLAKVLNQLVEQIPLPLLFMRTVIQAIGAFPGLVDFIMEILLRLVSKQIWRFPKLWVGFLKCAFQTKPQSFNVLLQLPAIQLENALSRIPALRAPLTSHASQPNIRATLPRSSLAVLGLAPDSQTSSQAHTTQTADTSNSVAEAAATTNSSTEAAAGETTQELVASS